MNGSNRGVSSPCQHSMGRRRFLGAAGISALALKTSIFDFASTLFADVARPAPTTRIRAVFVRPEADQYWMGWPGASYNPQTHQAEYTKVMTEAAKSLGVQLEVNAVPLHEPDSVSNFLEQFRKSPSDGIIVTVMHLKSWPHARYIVENRGDAPAIVFSPLGTSFTEQHQAVADMAKTFVAATPDSQWLATGVRLLSTIHQMKSSRICIVAGDVAADRVFAPIGTTLHYVPLERWVDEFRKASTTEEMREVAKYYAVEAKDIVEPEKEDLLNAARGYVVARRIMAAEKCQGISVDCSRLLRDKRVPCGMCLAWSRLLDEGCVAACEGDANAAITMLLTGLLCQRPGFMQDPAPNTVDNTLVGSHCTCATRLEGYEKPPHPFRLRSHYETNTGVSLQVQWRPDEEVTITKFLGPDSLLIGTGRVIRNIESSSSGGCRTSVEIRLDGVSDVRDLKGHHQVFVCGKMDAPLRAYCRLAGVKVVSA